MDDETKYNVKTIGKCKCGNPATIKITTLSSKTKKSKAKKFCSECLNKELNK